ncbi:Glycosyltransferase [Yersinia aldovae ATCC 35236]|uniref:WbcN protein n=1 Tax=Yersinia aldovae TaxID=29483 RepID=A0A0T9UIE3_YERAL|nr:glycosyltransferase [Yersinia aldovae]EEP93734.1 Glycosyltransferase [Yersinia aldovae ATCC 35236]CNL44262.1 WbcN protein [Yersinia aldovae]CNL78338.1 WbcN protein [Yersinia aldovae]
MNILFIITGLGLGGAERQVCDLSDELSCQGHNIMIICLSGDVICRPQNLKIKVVNLNMRRTFFGGVKSYLKARQVIKNFSPDVIHSHMVHANIFSRLLRLTTYIPILISTAHSKNEGGHIRMLAYRLTDFLADISTNVSQEAVEEFIAKGATRKDKIVALHNGIDQKKFIFNSEWREIKRKELGVGNSTPLLLAIGRLTEAKDYPNLLKAFACLDMVPKAQLAVIGSGELDGQLKELAINLNCDERIYWLGMQTNVEEWLSACDLFVLSSRWEGFGLVVAEAMSCERPLVVTDAGGVAEVVGNSQLVVPVSDSKALAEKIAEVLNYSDEEINLILSKNRQRVIDNFSIKNIAQQWLKIYKV